MGILNSEKYNEIIKYYILFFVYAVCIGGYVPYSTLFLRNLGLNSQLIARIVMIIPAAAIILQPLLGKAADKMNKPKIIVTILVLVILVGILSLIIYQNTVIITIVMSFIAISNGAVYSILVAQSLIYLRKHDLLSKFSTVRLLYSIGYGAVSLIMTFLFKDNISLAFRISVGFGIVTLIMVQTIKWHSEKPYYNKIKILGILRKRELTFFLVFSLLLSISTAQTYTYLPILYKELNISDNMYALSSLLMIISEIPIFLVFSKWYKKLSVHKIILVPIVSILVRTLLLAMTDNLIIILLSNLLNGLGFVLIQLTITLYAKNKVREEELSTLQSFITSVIYSGARLISALLVMVLIKSYSIKHIQKLNSMYMLVVLIIYFIYYVNRNGFIADNTSLHDNPPNKSC